MILLKHMENEQRHCLKSWPVRHILLRALQVVPCHVPINLNAILKQNGIEETY